MVKNVKNTQKLQFLNMIKESINELLRKINFIYIRAIFGGGCFNAIINKVFAQKKDGAKYTQLR